MTAAALGRSEAQSSTHGWSSSRAKGAPGLPRERSGAGRRVGRPAVSRMVPLPAASALGSFRPPPAPPGPCFSLGEAQLEVLVPANTANVSGKTSYWGAVPILEGGAGCELTSAISFHQDIFFLLRKLMMKLNHAMRWWFCDVCVHSLKVR